MLHFVGDNLPTTLLLLKSVGNLATIFLLVKFVKKFLNFVTRSLVNVWVKQKYLINYQYFY